MMPFAVTNDAARKGDIAVDPIRMDNMSRHAMLSLRRRVTAGVASLATTLRAGCTADAATERETWRD